MTNIIKRRIMNFYEAAIRTVCTAYDITPEVLRGDRRDERIVEARKWYCLLTTPRPLERSGRYINRDHATVLHHRREMREAIGIYPLHEERWRVMKRLFNSILVEDRMNGCHVGVKEYRAEWRNYQDLLLAAENARHRLEELSTSITGEPCVVCENGDGGFHVVKVRDRIGRPLPLVYMLNVIRKRDGQPI